MHNDLALSLSLSHTRDIRIAGNWSAEMRHRLLRAGRIAILCFVSGDSNMRTKALSFILDETPYGDCVHGGRFRPR